MKRVVVTGASGFIGKHSLESLLNKGYEVHAIAHGNSCTEIKDVIWHTIDLLDFKQIDNLIKDVKPSHLLHFAWDVTPGYRNSLNNFNWVQASIELIKKFQEQGGKRVVAAGTCFQYEHSTPMFSESETPRFPATTYGICKQSLQNMLEAFSKETGLSSAWGHIFFLYGPHENPSRLVSSVIISLLNNKHADCTEGTQIRDFMHVQDVADAFVELLDSDVQGPVNIASGKAVSLKEIIQKIGEVTDKPNLIKLGARQTPPDEVKIIAANINRLANEVNWTPKYDLDKGIKQTIEWWKRHISEFENQKPTVLRAKTVELLKTKELTEQQNKNSEINIKELKDQKLKLDSYPRRLVLELTNACNLKCIMCGRDETEFATTKLDLDYFKKIEGILNTVEEVTLFGWGEPTMHPQFIDILKYLDKFPVRKYFVTNGLRLDKIYNAIFDYNVDIMAVSLDGATAATNNRIRVGSNFDKIVSNLKKIVEEKKQRNQKSPYINFIMTTMKSNYKELPAMVELAHEIGLEEVKSVLLTVFSENLLDESLYDCQDEVRKVFDETIKLGEKLGIKIKLPYLKGEDPAGDNYHKPCFVGWRDFFLGSDGYVRPCQSTPMKLFKYSKYDTFEEMWNSEEYQDFRSRVNNQKTMPEECKRCYQSSHANWNRKESFIQTGQIFAPDWEKDSKAAPLG